MPNLPIVSQVLALLSGRSKKSGNVSVPGISYEDRWGCFCVVVCTTDEEGLDQGREATFGSHWEGDRDFLHGNSHLVWRDHQSQKAVTKEIQSLRSDSSWLYMKCYPLCKSTGRWAAGLSSRGRVPELPRHCRPAGSIQKPHCPAWDPPTGHVPDDLSVTMK